MKNKPTNYSQTNKAGKKYTTKPKQKAKASAPSSPYLGKTRTARSKKMTSGSNQGSEANILTGQGGQAEGKIRQRKQSNRAMLDTAKSYLK